MPCHITVVVRACRLRCRPFDMCRWQVHVERWIGRDAWHMGPRFVEAGASAKVTLKAAASTGCPDRCVHADERCAGLGAAVCDSRACDTLERYRSPSCFVCGILRAHPDITIFIGHVPANRNEGPRRPGGGHRRGRLRAGFGRSSRQCARRKREACPVKAACPPAEAAVPARFGRPPRRLDRRASSLRATGRLAENGEALRSRRRGSPG